MMRIFRGILIFLATVILFLTAFNYAASGLWGLPTHPVVNWLERGVSSPEKLNPPVVWRTFWAATGALTVGIWLISIFLWQSRSRALPVRTTNGELVLIHPGALIKFVRLQVESHPAVVAHRARVRQKGREGLAVWVMATVRTVDTLENIKRQLEEKIRSGFAQVLGIDHIDELTVVIGLDEKNLTQRPGPSGAAAPKPEPPLRGPLERTGNGETPRDAEPPLARNGEGKEMYS